MRMDEFNILVDAKLNEQPQSRRGQAAFLVAWGLIGEKLNNIIGTDKDPHYSDDKLPAFMVYLVDNGFFNEV